MGAIANEIQEHRRNIEESATEIAECVRKIGELQKSCTHTWHFKRQWNNHHVTNWNVTYQCTECEVERTDRDRLPVCEVCDVSLVRAKKGDKEAETERKKDEHKGHYNPPLAFRCPQCQKIHILWHLGD